MAAQAVKQHEQFRATIRDLTLKALQTRDLGLQQINGVIHDITAGINMRVGDDKTDTFLRSPPSRGLLFRTIQVCPKDRVTFPPARC
jgi:hypothetical protein